MWNQSRVDGLPQEPGDTSPDMSFLGGWGGVFILWHVLPAPCGQSAREGSGLRHGTVSAGSPVWGMTDDTH